MMLGSSLFHARKRAGLTQEEVAERLGVSRQTIGKWEADETLPDIRQSKRLATLYGVTLDDLIEFDLGVSQVEEAIERSTEELEEKIDWTSAWAKKYPILATYLGEVNVPSMRAASLRCSTSSRPSTATRSSMPCSPSRTSSTRFGRRARPRRPGSAGRGCKRQPLPRW